MDRCGWWLSRARDRPERRLWSFRRSRTSRGTAFRAGTCPSTTQRPTSRHSALHLSSMSWSLGRRPGREWLVSSWERARIAAERSPGGIVMVLDEIQRIANWSGVVKGLWDRDRRTGCPLRVVILGSAPWAMLTGIHESLAGRFDPFPVAHWSLDEMQRAFGVTLDEYIFFGGYPGAAVHIRNPRRWRGYVRQAVVAPVVERDILSLTRVKKPSLMRALLDLASEYSGQMVSYRKLQGQLDDAGNTTTLAHYLDLLADAGLVTGLEKHSAKPHLVKRSSPKLNVSNTAVMTVGYPGSFEHVKYDGTFWGRLCESAVGAHLLNTLSPDGIVRLRYWRDATPRGRLRAVVETKPGGHRGEERPATRQTCWLGGVPSPFPRCQAARGGNRWRAAERVPV